MGNVTNISRKQAAQENIKLVREHLMAKNCFVSRSELCNIVGWDYTKSNDRKIREVLSTIAKKYPLISTSDGYGYKLVNKNICTREELQMLIHQFKENDKRAHKILARNAPLDAAIKREMMRLHIHTYTELERYAQGDDE